MCERISALSKSRTNVAEGVPVANGEAAPLGHRAAHHTFLYAVKMHQTADQPTTHRKTQSVIDETNLGIVVAKNQNIGRVSLRVIHNRLDLWEELLLLCHVR